MRYENITAGELSKMDGKRVIAKTTGSCEEEKNGRVIQGEITIQHGNIYILHNNMHADGSRPNDMKGYSYSRIIGCTIGALKEPKDNIEWLQTIEEFVEGEEVYCSDDSIEDAIANKNIKSYIYTKKSGIHVLQSSSNYLYNDDCSFQGRKYIAKVPKEEVVEMTMEQVNKALGKKIKIVE